MKKLTLFLATLLSTVLNFVVEAQVSKTATCTAGNLATVAASYLNTVTNLTVTGTIDARDFKTMRDVMPLLEVIDLSGSTVESYTGTDGTDGATLRIYPLNGIPDYAFYNSSTYKSKVTLKSFIYPSSVTTIGFCAFRTCTGFTGSLTIPSSVITIGDNAFFGCSGLTGSLTIPDLVTTIGSSAFANCFQLSGSLTIPASVTTIEKYAFSGCRFTGSLSIPSSVTSIGDYAFLECNGFSGSLTISSSVKTIGVGTFWNCYGFTGSLTIPSSVTTIGQKAFFGCSSFTGSLTIPSSLTTIGDGAFSRCGFTGSLTIPASVTKIGFDAFYGFKGLFIVDSANPNYSSLDGIVYNKDKTTLILCPNSKIGSLTIPSSVKIISEIAFAGCSGLTGLLTIPSSVTTIGDNAFRGCNGFSGSLIIPASVTTIGNSAFAGCSGFTGSLTIPASVTTIGLGAFNGFNDSFIVDPANPNYSSLDGVIYNKNKTTINQCSISKAGSFIIPSSVVTIDKGAFSGCSALTTITIPASVKVIGASAFEGCLGLTSFNSRASVPVNFSQLNQNVFSFDFRGTASCVLHVPIGLKAKYAAATEWKNFSTIVDDIVLTELDKIKVAAKTVACTAGNLATLTASYTNSVTNLTVTGTIDARDFKFMRDNMLSLDTINLSGSTVVAYTGVNGSGGYSTNYYPAKGIPANAFHSTEPNARNFEGLKSFSFPTTVTSIGKEAFSGCSGLATLTIPSFVKSIGSYAFTSCSGLTSIYAKITTPVDISASYNVFDGVNKSITLHVPVDSKFLYMAANQWKDFTNIVADIAPSELDKIKVVAKIVDCTAGNLATLTASFLNSVTKLTITGTIDARDFKFMRDNMLSLDTINLSGCTVVAYSGFDGPDGNFTRDYPANGIPSNAFHSTDSNASNFDGLKSFSFPTTVTSIGKEAFRGCSGLNILTIPSLVTTIVNGAFKGCSGLTSIFALANTPVDLSTPSSYSVFQSVNKTIPLHVPLGSKALYATADQWKDFTNIVEDIIPTELEETSSISNSISIYPNPATSSIIISELSSLVSDKSVTLSVVDALASTLLVKDVEPSLNAVTLDVSIYKNGIYFIVIQTSNGRVVKRFVKK